ncbi:TonB-dependent vitamin B12 receptor [Dyella amyloliquefaciens]|uniref:TonB-dependent vitamin B12 receptor n=1 Tax=Dyella amyloliquefaciens TaxID=1770545 RepID=UPI00102E28BC|nr:TonB-dependent vitamin B12 receptor [Dyella amyloliquefaciens]
MKKTLLAAALLSATMAVQANDADQATSLSSVIVTATRTSITTDEALSSVSVITRADIERLQPASVRDLLVGLPGVSFAQSGGMGQLSSLFLRGTNSTHVLVLIDGVRIGAVGAGQPAFEQIPVDQIERIEIVRGPRSSLYGADAIGGVIQIFTRHGAQDGKLDPSLSVSTGSRSYMDGHAGLSGGDSHAWFNAGLGGQYTSGINACRVGAAELGVACFVDQPDNDAYRNWNGMANGGYRWDNGTELAATWLRSKSFVEYDGSPYGGNQAQNEQEVGGARLSFAPLAPWKVTLNAGQSRDDNATYFQGTYSDFYTPLTYYPRTPVGHTFSRRNQASWQNDITLDANQLLTAGVDYQQEHIDSDTGYLKSTREDAGVYAQYMGTFGRNEVQLSARHDHNDQFGNHDTGSAAWGYAFDHGLRLSASYGTAFHAPTFNDIYYPFGLGNPDLKPEKSRSGELGLTQAQGAWNWAVNVYQTTITDLITLDENFVPQNISQARIRGLEGQFGINLDGWQVQSYLTLMQPKNQEGTYDGNLLPRRPEQTARVDLDRHFGAFGVGATFFASGKAYDDQANLHRLGGYTTTDLRASYDFLPNWRVEARLANAFDRNYETAYYFNQPGRSWFLTLRYSPALR